MRPLNYHSRDLLTKSRLSILAASALGRENAVPMARAAQAVRRM
jgi:hypothetical protein